MERVFLRAHWSHLCVLSYEAPADLIARLCPRGLEPDLRDGKAFVSLVAFDFENAEVRGCRVPFHSDFPEVNLRYYARVKAGQRHAGDRGVCFVREFVPRRLVALVARRVYNEPYEAVPMESDVHRTPDGLEVDHRFRHHGRWQEIKVGATRDPPLLPQEDGVESFFIDQQWGFGRDRTGMTLRYRVVHPRWMVHRVEWAEVKVNWGKTYGPEWKWLDHEKPCSSILAEGSEVAVCGAEHG